MWKEGKKERKEWWGGGRSVSKGRRNEGRKWVFHFVTKFVQHPVVSNVGLSSVFNNELCHLTVGFTSPHCVTLKVSVFSFVKQDSMLPYKLSMIFHLDNKSNAVYNSSERNIIEM